VNPIPAPPLVPDSENVPPPMLLPAPPADPLVSEIALSIPAPGLMMCRLVAGAAVMLPDRVTEDGQAWIPHDPDLAVLTVGGTTVVALLTTVLKLPIGDDVKNPVYDSRSAAHQN
jgi:hypothetical protein